MGEREWVCLGMHTCKRIWCSCVCVCARARAVTVANMFTSNSKVNTTVNPRSTLLNNVIDEGVGLSADSQMFAKKFNEISPATNNCTASDM
jgi:hypothetical protein